MRPLYKQKTIWGASIGCRLPIYIYQGKDVLKPDKRIEAQQQRSLLKQ